MLRYALAAVILAATASTVPAAPAPKKDCSAAFVAQWSHNREAALRQMPKGPAGCAALPEVMSATAMAACADTST